MFGRLRLGVLFVDRGDGLDGCVETVCRKGVPVEHESYVVIGRKPGRAPLFDLLLGGLDEGQGVHADTSDELAPDINSPRPDRES